MDEEMEEFERNTKQHIEAINTPLWMRARLSCIWMGAGKKSMLYAEGRGLWGNRGRDSLVRDFISKSLIDNASFSTNLIGAVFRQVRRQEIMSLFSVFPLAQNPAGL